MIDTIVATLVNDATLAALLTGGVQRAQEISRQATPGAFDANLEVKPCALVKQEMATRWGPLENSGRVYVVVWLYERSGYGSIEAARKRIYALLHRKQLSGSVKLYWIEHGNDLLDQEDAATGWAMIVSRYVCTVERA